MNFIKVLTVISLLIYCTSCATQSKVESTEEQTDIEEFVEAVEIEEIETAVEDDVTSETTSEDLSSESSNPCDITVYLVDPDESGTNVRDEPKGNIIRQLKYDEDCFCLIVRVINAKDGWLELREGGWVYANLFAVDSRNYGENEIVYLNEYSTDESQTTAEYNSEQHFTVLGCENQWILVKGKDGKVGFLAPNMQCANPLTTCS